MLKKLQRHLAALGMARDHARAVKLQHEPVQVIASLLRKGGDAVGAEVACLLGLRRCRPLRTAPLILLTNQQDLHLRPPHIVCESSSTSTSGDPRTTCRALATGETAIGDVACGAS